MVRISFIGICPYDAVENLGIDNSNSSFLRKSEIYKKYSPKQEISK